jgi:Uma2 family endonuclease
MDAVTATGLMTAQEFLDLPPQESADRHELVDGEIIVSAGSWMHSGAQGRIFFALHAWERAASGRGAAGMPIGVLLDERNLFVPDVVWYREGRVPGRDDPVPYAAPDLAVEVRSPSTWRYDIGAKKNHYEAHGVAELWLVDTAADVLLAFRRSSPKAAHFDVSIELAAGETLTSPLLPGFAVAVAEIFGDR